MLSRRRGFFEFEFEDGWVGFVAFPGQKSETWGTPADFAMQILLESG